MNSFRNTGLRALIATFTFCLFLTAASTLQAAEYASVKSNGVNVRSGPSTDKDVRWEVFKGFPMEILERENGWVKCRDFEGDSGWIHSDLLSDNKTVIVKKKKINLRNVPNTGKDSKILAVVKYGVVFKAISKDGEWLKVRHSDSTEGWIHQKLIWPSDPLD
jgi:SH3-like domain-containing protein